MFGGIKAVIENLKVKNIVISKQNEKYQNFKEIMDIVKRKKINVMLVKRGDKIIFDNSAYADILYPTEPLAHSDINNNSIVTKFMSQGTSILFTRRYRKGSRREDTEFVQ